MVPPLTTMFWIVQVLLAAVLPWTPVIVTGSLTDSPAEALLVGTVTEMMPAPLLVEEIEPLMPTVPPSSG